jgi:hypothetical protein
MTKPTNMTCDCCGGTDVVKDAFAEWDGYRWVLHSVYDSATCQTCGTDTTLTETEEHN